jgi:predicted metal-binding membrane protein
VRARPRVAPDVALLLALVGLSAVAWVATSRLADPGMRIGILTGAADQMMAEGTMAADQTVAFVLFMATWTVMMVAMMFPTVAPVVLTFNRWAQSKSRPRSATWAFIGGYLGIWSLVGAIVYAVVLVLQALVPASDPNAMRIGGALLVVAGAYQLTPLKDLCLRHCRSPLGVVMQHADQLAEGHLGPFRVGLIHGRYCIGCCWSLMLGLVLLGMMNLVWMGVVAAVVFAEKVLPRGDVLSRVTGVAMIALGGAVAAGLI